MVLLSRSITNFSFHSRLDILTTQTKIDEAIVTLSPPVFTSILLPFSSFAKDARSDSTSVTFPFFPSRDSQLDKFANQTMTNEAIVSLSLSVSLPFHHLSRLALAFGAGRYNHKQIIMIARILQSNFPSAIRVIERGTEKDFRPRILGSLEATVWEDFMTLQMRMMPGMNHGVAYLVEIRNSIKHTYAVAVFGDHKVIQVQPARLEAVHFEANTTDDRWALMIVQRPDTNSRNTTRHKAAMTLPLSLSSDINSAKEYGQHVLSVTTYQQFSIGGSCCFVCSIQMAEEKSREDRQQQQLSQYSLDTVFKKRVPEKMLVQIKRRRSILEHQRHSSTRILEMSHSPQPNCLHTA